MLGVQFLWREIHWVPVLLSFFPQEEIGEWYGGMVERKEEENEMM